MGEHCLVPLKSGGCAIVDAKFKEVVEKSKWTWDRHGVVSYDKLGDKNYEVLLHSLIAPFNRVSFKNGCKWDCRIENLIEWDGPRPHIKKGSGIYDEFKKNRFQINRGIKCNGVKYQYRTSIAYKRKISKERALEKATELRDFLFSMNYDEFKNYTQTLPLKRVTKNEILSTYDCFKGRQCNPREMVDDGITGKYEVN